jgi:putative flippase GtrA
MIPKKYIVFLSIGSVAWLVDLWIYQSLSARLNEFQLGIYVAKTTAVIFGLAITYLLNSWITFKSSISLARLLLYAAAQSPGALSNVASFSFYLLIIPVVPALILASLTASVVNYFFASFVLSR